MHFKSFMYWKHSNALFNWGQELMIGCKFVMSIIVVKLFCFWRTNFSSAVDVISTRLRIGQLVTFIDTRAGLDKFNSTILWQLTRLMCWSLGRASVTEVSNQQKLSWSASNRSSWTCLYQWLHFWLCLVVYCCIYSWIIRSFVALEALHDFCIQQNIYV